MTNVNTKETIKVDAIVLEVNDARRAFPKEVAILDALMAEARKALDYLTDPYEARILKVDGRETLEFRGKYDLNGVESSMAFRTETQPRLRIV